MRNDRSEHIAARTDAPSTGGTATVARAPGVTIADSTSAPWRSPTAALGWNPAIARMLRWLWAGVIVGGCVVFVGTHGSDLVDAASSVPRLQRGPTAIGVSLSCAAMLNRAGKSRASHRAVGLEVRPWSMVLPTMVGFAADKVVRFGGLCGLAVMLKHGDRLGYARASVLASTVVAKAANLVALVVFFALAVGSLWLDRALAGWWLAAGGGLAFYLAAIGMGVAALTTRGARARRWWSWIEQRSPLPRQDAAEQHPIETIACGMRTARILRFRTLQVVLHAVGAKALGVGLLVAAAHAVGTPLGPLDAFVVYATVLLASLASITPGGVGAVEVSAVTVMVGAGVVMSEAVLVVAIFRAFDLWLPLLVGGAAAVLSRVGHRSVPGVGAATTPIPPPV